MTFETDSKDRKEVLQATEDDLNVILDWLERECQEDGGGFWSNRGVIARSLEDDDLWAIRECGHTIAFQVGKYGTDIVCVRKDYRSQGYGTALFNFSLARTIEDDVNILCGECSPPTSLPFWQKMGFEQYGDSSVGAPITVRRVLHRKHDIDAMLPKIEATVSFYPGAAIYSSEGETPFKVHRLTGGLLENGGVKLPYRVIGLADDEKPGKDLVVKIVVDGDELCFCKAKYDEAKATGVQYDSKGHNFYIDEIAIGPDGHPSGS